jgi:small-conductance mechanosensitive channel
VLTAAMMVEHVYRRLIGLETYLNGIEHPLARNGIVTIAVLLLLLVVRKVVLRAVISREMPPEIRRRIEVSSRNAVFGAVFLVAFFVWAEEIRTLALSAFAVAAAIVLATKELIMCISGSLFRSSARSFSVGDRIEVGTFRGDVIDTSMLTTRLVEIGPGQASHQHTGRMISLPNSVFLTQAVINETYTDQFVLHTFTIPISSSDPWETAERLLLESANEECTPYLEMARTHFDQMVGRHSLEAVQVEPRVSIRKVEPGRIDLIVRIPSPARRKGRVEQAIIRRFLRAMSKEAPAPKDGEASV